MWSSFRKLKFTKLPDLESLKYVQYKEKGCFLLRRKEILLKVDLVEEKRPFSCCCKFASARGHWKMISKARNIFIFKLRQRIIEIKIVMMTPTKKMFYFITGSKILWFLIRRNFWMLIWTVHLFGKIFFLANFSWSFLLSIKEWWVSRKLHNVEKRSFFCLKKLDFIFHLFLGMWVLCPSAIVHEETSFFGIIIAEITPQLGNEVFFVIFFVVSHFRRSSP